MLLFALRRVQHVLTAAGRTGAMRSRHSSAALVRVGVSAATIVGVVVAGGCDLHAQSEAGVAFETASVKPNTQSGNLSESAFTPSRVLVRNLPLRYVIMQAYMVRWGQVVEGPDWIDRERFDIVAVPPPGTTAVSARLMLQRLLNERFGLRVRKDTREASIYALTRARSDGLLGVGLRPTPGGCEPAAQCRARLTPGAVRGEIKWIGLVDVLAGAVDRMMLDRTGLDGFFDVSLNWSPRVAVTGSPDDTSIYSAVREQLGLELKPERGPVDVIVIEGVSRPRPD